jgi:DNA-binding CsgD family transcriptional regulator/PAS domain-containing protein
VVRSEEAPRILLELVNRIYEAPDRQEMLNLIHRSLKGPLELSPAAALIPVDPQSGRYQLEGNAVIPSSSKWLEDWLIFYSKLDPLAGKIHENSNHKALRYTDVISGKQHLESLFYKEFLSTIPMTWVLALPLSSFGEKLGVIWLSRQDATHEFTEFDCEIGTTVSHHAGIALQVQEWRSHPPMDANPGILVVDGKGRIIYQNEEAERIFEKKGMEWLLGNAPQSEVRIVQTNLGAFRARTFFLRRTSDPVLPFVPPEARGKVVVLEPYPPKILLCQQMKELDLSKRQSQLVLEIMRGRTNKEISEKLGVTLQTVKDHLHDIYRQLNVRNRSELIIRVMGNLLFSDTP